MGKNTSILLNKRSKDLKDVSNQTFAKKKKKKKKIPKRGEGLLQNKKKSKKIKSFGLWKSIK